MAAVEIRTGVPASDQESSFQNATLQSTWRTGRDGTRELSGTAFSIATRVEIPESFSHDPERVAAYLRDILTQASLAARGLTFEVEVGREDA